MQGRYILAIESSCDETAVAIMENGTKILSSLVSSQIARHRPFGGVVPELAARCHAEVINPIIDKALEEAGLKLKDLDAIAVTHGPGLIGALLVGLAAAKALAAALEIPLVAVNHLRSHVYSNFVTTLPSPSGEGLGLGGTEDSVKNLFVLPYLVLLVSGGHTQLIEMKSHTQLSILAETGDDAVGEAFDKVARLLQLGYPGGPAVQNAAAHGDPKKVRFNLSKDSDRFSFSGIKTAVLTYIKKHPETDAADIAASFQASVIEALVHKTVAAAKERGIPRIMLCGGVAANTGLRAGLEAACAENNFSFSVPPFALCTDNAAMVGCAAYFQLLSSGASSLEIEADPNLVLA